MDARARPAPGRSGGGDHGGAPVSVVEVDGLRYEYPGGEAALDGVSFTIEDGERVALLGPNGAGKTTLVLSLLGVLMPAAGEVRVLGETMDEEHAFELRRHLGLVFQDPNDQLFMPTVRDDVAFGPANYGVSGAELEAVVERALATVSATHLAKRAPHHLSGGERRRVAIAGVLAMDPAALIMDEPSSGLDPAGMREITDLLLGLDQTLLLVTHHLDLAERLCDRALVLDDGHLVHDGPLADVLSDRDFLTEHRLA
ncbi:MAG: ABC transporter ATP-binding protein [Acidimicrobiia bacterium]|nr:ABC transporter ATP-binding protein [Acidimicrobiia bacterium]